jgi:hypothetical protein
VFVIETPLKASVRVLVLMAAPKRERIALELKKMFKVRNKMPYIEIMWPRSV